jgi:hypothetical protein
MAKKITPQVMENKVPKKMILRVIIASHLFAALKSCVFELSNPQGMHCLVVVKLELLAKIRQLEALHWGHISIPVITQV